MTTNHKKHQLLKIIIIGESSVGKTAILHRYVNNRFIEEHKATIGADFSSSQEKINDYIATLQIWDTAGQERFDSLGNVFYRGVDGCILVYDITNIKSFEKIEDWRKNFLQISSPEDPKRFPFLLIGNKNDLINKRKVTQEDGKSYAIENNMGFYETSALNDTNIRDAFRSIASLAIDSVSPGRGWVLDDVEVAEKIDLSDVDDEKNTSILKNMCGCSYF